MGKKLKPAVDDDSLATAVRISAAQIWQAGLGAFAKAQEEGSRVLAKLPGKGARPKGPGGMLEQVFEERVARALATIGVPDHDELSVLRQRVDALTQQVERLAAALEAQSPKPVRKAKTAAKPAAKAVAKKAAARKTQPRAK